MLVRCSNFWKCPEEDCPHYSPHEFNLPDNPIYIERTEYVVNRPCEILDCNSQNFHDCECQECNESGEIL